MFLADAGIAVWVVGLLLVGFLGFFLVAVSLVFRLISWIFRMLTGGNAADGQQNKNPHNSGNRLTCPHQGCGHANVPTAFFCGRCGRPVRRPYDVDAYG